KPGTPLTDAMSKLEPGAKVECSLASGVGFPLPAAQGKALLLVASGTGQAPMRSVIEAVRARRTDFGPVTLLLGVRDEEHLAFGDEEEAWKNDGIHLQVTLSRGGQSWSGLKGRVQLHLPSGDLSGPV